MRLLKSCILAVATLQASAACADTCPPPLDTALRLVLVIAPSMHSAGAQMRRFERKSADHPWEPLGTAEPVVVGQAGLGWGATFLHLKQGNEPEKREGDRRTPAGFFRIGASFGFAPSPTPGHVTLKAGETVCVDDPASEFYNSIKPRSAIGAKTSGEDMRLIPLYSSGLFVDYPSDRETRRGSCIFIHVWKGPGAGTLGCVALPDARVRALQSFAETGNAVLAVLPSTSLARVSHCLPDADAGAGGPGR